MTGICCLYGSERWGDVVCMVQNIGEMLSVWFRMLGRCCLYGKECEGDVVCKAQNGREMLSVWFRMPGKCCLYGSECQEDVVWMFCYCQGAVIKVVLDCG